MSIVQSTNPSGNGATPLKRVAIIGTASSWKQCPWDDHTLEVWGLNDGYMMGVPRATRWYDLHPFHQMYFRDPKQRVVDPAVVPIGSYIRPAGHLDWLKSRPFPVYLAQANVQYPTSRRFPQEDVLAWFARYWPWRMTRYHQITPGRDYEVSTPSWMVMHAIMEGYREIAVFGIELRTEWEYVEQRPNFEWLLGLAAGLGAKIVLPSSAPICQARYRYAFEPKADLPMQRAQQMIVTIKQQGLALRQRLARCRWWHVNEKAGIVAKLAQLDIDLADARHQLQRVQIQLAS